MVWETTKRTKTNAYNNM